MKYSHFADTFLSSFNILFHLYYIHGIHYDTIFKVQNCIRQKIYPFKIFGYDAHKMKIRRYVWNKFHFNSKVTTSRFLIDQLRGCKETFTIS